MIGIVVVTHGRLAEELVNAARTIVGDIPGHRRRLHRLERRRRSAREAIERGLAEVGGGDALILTDMFGGTPTNLSLPFLSPRVEIVTGVNLPMLIKLIGLREGTLAEVARVVRDQGKGAIYVASEVLEKKPALIRREVRIRNRLGLHARAAARFVHTANRVPGADHGQPRTDASMDGKSILGILLLAASQGTAIELAADGEDEAAAVEALAALVEAASERRREREGGGRPWS